MTQFSVYRLLLGFGLSLLMAFPVYAGFLDDIKKLEDLKKAGNLEHVLEQNTKKSKNEQQNKQAQKKERREKQRAARQKQREKQRAEKAKKKEDRRKAKIKAEEAEWEAKVAEEKARKAEKQVEQAEHTIYQEELDLAVKENKQAIERARKKDKAERVPTHDHRSADWYIAHKGVGQFKKALNKYEVDGLSLGMKISVLEKALISRGYKLHSRKIINGGPKYTYRRKKEKNISTVEIRAAGFNDVPNLIIIDLHNAGGKKMIAEEKIRLLKAFSGACVLIRNYAINCFKYTDTNVLSIKANFSRKPIIQYSIHNLPSRDARR